MAIPTLVGVVALAFALLYVMPGDPVQLLVSSFQGEGTKEQMDEIRTRLGLKDPIPVQFGRYVADVARGDLGTSILKSRPVSALIWEALPHTLELAGLAVVMAMCIGTPVGVVSAVTRGTWIDRGSVFATLLGVSAPDFWVAMLAVLIFAVRLRWFPAFGIGGVTFLILPAAVIGIRASAAVARLTRSSMLEVLGRQYVMTARAKGLRELSVIGTHALRNALIPVVTLLGLEFGRLIGGAVVVETVFARQGIGSLLVGSILDKDLPVLRGTILVVAVSYIVLNLIVDVSYGWLDPRIRARLTWTAQASEYRDWRCREPEASGGLRTSPRDG
jgi:ABC-type dipeptide/oligopeptide/nickel transport system permease component